MYTVAIILAVSLSHSTSPASDRRRTVPRHTYKMFPIVATTMLFFKYASKRKMQMPIGAPTTGEPPSTYDQIKRKENGIWNGRCTRFRHNKPTQPRQCSSTYVCKIAKGRIGNGFESIRSRPRLPLHLRNTCRLCAQGEQRV